MAIGQRVFVDSAGSRSGSVALADVSGKVLSATQLADGSEVEVVAWRPRGANETRYRVRAPGVDGWLAAENLRSALVAVPRVDAAQEARATVGVDTGTRPFGQRSHVGHVPSSPSVAPLEARPIGNVPDPGGRRFGQH